MSEYYNLPHFCHDELEFMTVVQAFRRAYTVMAEPSLDGTVPLYAEESYAVEEGLYETIYMGAELLKLHPEECATLGIEDDDEVAFTVQVPADERHISTFVVSRYSHGDIDDMRVAWVINGPEGDFRTRITGDAIEDDDLCDVPLMQEELDAINAITRSLFPEAPEFP